jgi:hypothetical protein
MFRPIPGQSSFNLPKISGPSQNLMMSFAEGGKKNLPVFRFQTLWCYPVQNSMMSTAEGGKFF